MTPLNHNMAWSREELVLALYLYCQIPFAKTTAKNPEIIHLATIIGRTPSSVARKLGNFGAFDPALAQRGIKGLTHFSKADREIWNDFYNQWDDLVDQSQQILAAKNTAEVPYIPDEMPVISRPTKTTERSATVLIRLGQSFFRRTVLSSYEYSCCICGIDIPLLLIGSHIKPWSVSEEHRINPENGLCLCTLHDKAFDRGLIAIDQNLSILISPIVSKSRSEFAKTTIQNFEGQRMRLPRRFAPNLDCLDWHKQNIFQL